MTQSTFSGYQINESKLVIHGTVTQDVISDILIKEDVTQVATLQLNGCIGNDVRFWNLNESFKKLRKIKFTDMQLNQFLFIQLRHRQVTELSFERCTVPDPETALRTIHLFPKLQTLNLKDTEMSEKEMEILKEGLSNINKPVTIMGAEEGRPKRERDAPSSPPRDTKGKRSRR